LELKGITVVGKARDGNDAVLSYADLRPDIVFLDVLMSKGGGFLAVEMIRRIEPDALIIVVTSDNRDETRRRLLDLGASAIIYKPYDIGEVMDTANMLLMRLRHDLLEDIEHKKDQIRRLNELLSRRFQGC